MIQDDKTVVKMMTLVLYRETESCVKESKIQLILIILISRWMIVVMLNKFRGISVYIARNMIHNMATFAKLDSFNIHSGSAASLET